MSMTKGTPASSQIIWLEGRVQELESEIERLGRLLLRQDQMLTEQDKEIERLRECVETYQTHKRRLIGDLNEYAEEIGRLREALKRIAALRYGLQALIEDGANEEAIDEYWAGTALNYQKIARAALAATERPE